MPIFCEDIPHTDNVQKSLFGNVKSMVRIRYNGESKIPGIVDVTNLSPSVLPSSYKKYADEIEKFKVYEDDIWVTSFPKSGTTWVAEMVWLMANNLDYVTAKKIKVTDRYGFVERTAVMDKVELVTVKNTVEISKALARPRFIKTHLPIAMIPTEFWSVNPKLVYVVRNPKDAAISYYHHYLSLFRYKGSLNDFLDSFLNDLVCWSPYREHILDFYKLRSKPNVLFIRYEDMSKDLKSVLHVMAKFLGKTFTDDQFDELAKHLSFSEMSKNPAVNNESVINGIQQGTSYKFIRRGEVNSSKDEMPAEYHEKFDDWLAKAFNGSDFNFNV